jgi:D-glycero-D-manno-heptose 1,7-bisphosphate phosphatase
VSRRFVILDRDGTLIVERNYLSDPADVELLPEVPTGLRMLRELGMGLIVITNQSGIGRGYFDPARLDLVHGRMTQLLAAGGVELDGIYCCPHLPEEGCACRKPRPGLLLQAASEHRFVPEECIVIGDKPCDIDLGRRFGALTFLVTTGYGASFAAAGGAGADEVVDNLRQVAPIILARIVALRPT